MLSLPKDFKEIGLWESSGRLMTFDHRWNHVLTRGALGLLFLWFGMTGLFTPDTLVGYVPSWSTSFIEPFRVVFLNALLDTALGALLLLGLYTRAAAAIGALHVMGIALSIGYNDVMARDVALSLICAAVA